MAFLGLTEFSKRTGLSKNTIYKFTSRREIPHYKMGKKLLFDEKEAMEWFRKRLKRIEPVRNKAEKILEEID